MSDDKEIIDVKAVEIEDSDCLPAVIPADASNCDHIELPNRQDALLADNPERRCVATNSRGERCRKFAIYGATVCRTHGGATKRVREAARIRVENASNRLMGKLIDFAFDDAKPPDVQLKAIQNSLDRAGLKPPAEVVLSQGETKAAFETVFDSIGGDPEAAGFTSVPIADDGSAGQYASPAPAYDRYADGVKAEAGGGGGATGYGDTGQQDADFSADQQAEASSRDESPRQGRPRDHDRDRGHRRPAHITGEAAIRAANEANRAIGAMADQLAIESRHKRYLRP